MSTYFTSDTHFGHKNIIEFCNRPFDSVTAMDQGLIQRWNSVVGKNDIVYHLGDFAMRLGDDEIRDILRRLNGYKIALLGNHDERTIARKVSAFRGPDLFDEIHTGVLERKIDGQGIVMCHYAMRVWNRSHFGTWHLYGHSHGTLPDDPNILSTDVGVDCWDYMPVSMIQLRRTMAAKTFTPVDKHGS